MQEVSVCCKCDSKWIQLPSYVCKFDWIFLCTGCDKIWCPNCSN